MKTKGFTLVELLVVIAILAILATVSVVGYTSYIAKTEQTVADSEAASVTDAIDVALILNTSAYITVDPAEENAATFYLVFTRENDGDITVEKKTSAPSNMEKIDNLGELANRLTLGTDNVTVTYTSSKGKTATVGTYVAPAQGSTT